MPGLAEMHAHIPGGQAADSIVERVLFLYVSCGITTVRGMLGHPRHLELRARAARGELLSPTIYTSGPSFNGNTIPTTEAAATMVRQQKEAGYDFLKIHPGVKREVFDMLAATADRVRIRFAGHVPAEVGLNRAVESGYATIDHLDGYVEALLRDGAPLTADQSAFFGLNFGDYLDQSRLPALVEVDLTRFRGHRVRSAFPRIRGAGHYGLVPDRASWGKCGGRFPAAGRDQAVAPRLSTSASYATGLR